MVWWKAVGGKQHPNKQSNLYWANQVGIYYKQQGGRGIMRWAGLINGEVILHWFNVATSINKDVYLEMVQTVMWPRISRVSNRKRYWFQQDGAIPQGMADFEIWRTSHKPFR